MAHNYSIFHVEEPFNELSAGALAQKDYYYYNQLRTWKFKDELFPFNDIHHKKYDVRDGSDWDSVLKPRIKERLDKADNIILFLSENTFQSRGVKEELEYGIGYLKLPVIVLYADIHDKKLMMVEGKKDMSFKVHYFINKLPLFKQLKSQVPVLHVPLNKEMVSKALKKNNFVKNSHLSPNNYMLND